MSRRYAAFISYSHTDEFWARWLHRSLERYRPPRSISAERLVPIFRDRDELAASSNLSGAILEALDQSDALIVICSPAAAQSRWVNAEVEAFVAMGRADAVYAVIVDGEPNDVDRECLPAILRSADGHEPMAADLRPGGDGRAGAKLKVAAALLGVRFSDLRNRDNQARLQRLGLIAGASVLLSVAMLVLSVLAMLAREEAVVARVEAERQRQVAEREAEISGQVTTFLVDLFDISDPSEARGSSVTAREMLDRGAARINEEFADLPPIRARLLDTVGRVYESLGLYEPAESSLKEAVALYELGEDQAGLLRAIENLGWMYRETGRFEQSRASFERAAALSLQLHGEQHPERAVMLNYLGVAWYDLGEITKSLGYFIDARDLAVALGADAEDTKISATTNIANAFMDLGRSEEAVPYYREVMAYNLAALGEVHPQVGFDHDNLALALQELGELDEAEFHFRETNRILGIVFGKEHPEVAQAKLNLAAMLIDRGELAEAAKLYRDSIDQFERLISPDYYMAGDGYAGLADVSLAQDDATAALAAIETAIGVYERGLPAGHSRTREALLKKARILVKLEQFSAAEAMLLSTWRDLAATNEFDENVMAADFELLYTSWGRPVVIPNLAPLH